MKVIYSKNMSNRLAKEAGLWDGIKDFVGKVQTGWELGKSFKGVSPQQQRIRSMMYEHEYPKTADGRAIYTKPTGEVDKEGKPIIDPKTNQPMAVPHNPFYVPGFAEKMGGHHRYKLPKNYKINHKKVREYDYNVDNEIQEAMKMWQVANDKTFFDALVRNQTIIYEPDNQQPEVQQQAPNAPAPTNPTANPTI